MIRKLQKKYLFSSENQPSWQPLLKIVRKTITLAYAHLKKEQEISAKENHILNAKNIIEDIIISLVIYCNIRSFDLKDIIKKILK